MLVSLPANAMKLRRIPVLRVRKRAVFQTIVLGLLGRENGK